MGGAQIYSDLTVLPGKDNYLKRIKRIGNSGTNLQCFGAFLKPCFNGHHHPISGMVSLCFPPPTILFGNIPMLDCLSNFTSTLFDGEVAQLVRAQDS